MDWAAVKAVGRWISQSPLTLRDLGITAEMGFADAPAIENDGVAGFEVGMGGGLDGAGEVDAGDHRVAADDRGFAGEGEAVLVIDGRVRDADANIARHEVGGSEVLPANALATLAFFDHEGAKTICVSRHFWSPMLDSRWLAGTSVQEAPAVPHLPILAQEGEEKSKSYRALGRNGSV